MTTVTGELWYAHKGCVTAFACSVNEPLDYKIVIIIRFV